MEHEPDQGRTADDPAAGHRGRSLWPALAAILVASACAGLLIRTSSPRPGGPQHGAPAQPVLVFDRTLIDLGTIVATEQGETARFPFTNTGTAPLHLREVVTGCGCAGASVDRAVVPPGEQGCVVVRVRSERPEEKQVRLAVLTNEPSGAAHELSLKWRSRFPVELEVERIQFGQVVPGETVTRRLRVVRPPGLGPVDITAISALPQNALAAEYELRSTAEPEAAEYIDVTLTPVEGPASLQHGTIRLELSGVWKESISIPVEWTVREVLDVTPRHLFAGYAEAGARVSWTVRIAAPDDGPLEIDGIDLPADSFLKLRSRPGEGREVLLDVDGVLPDRPGPFAQEIQVRLAGNPPRKVAIGCSGVIQSPAVSQ